MLQFIGFLELYMEDAHLRGWKHGICSTVWLYWLHPLIGYDSQGILQPLLLCFLHYLWWWIYHKQEIYLLSSQCCTFAMVFWDQLGNNEWFDDLYVTYVYNVWNILPMQCNATVLDPLKAVPLCAVTIMVSATWTPPPPACMFSAIVSFSMPLTSINSTLVAHALIGPNAIPSVVSLIPDEHQLYIVFLGLLLPFSFCLSG